MSTPEGFKFVITNGAVTGMSRVDGTHTSTMRLPSDATFSIASGSITETRTGTKATETIQFVQDASDSSLYHIFSDLTVFNNTTSSNGGAYTFTISDGVVTGVQHVRGTSSHAEAIAPTSQYALSADGKIVETSVHDNVVETITYVAGSTAGQYVIASDAKTFVQAGSATTVLDVEGCDRAKFTIDASGAVTQVQQVRADGSTSTLTVGSNTTYKQLEAGYVLEVQTRGSHTSYELYHDGNGDGIYTEVAHGSGSTVDLVGLKAQLNATIDGLL
ncbi:hypothetical protein ACFFKC_09255 [Pseudoduganella danionis]|uniref:Uncharacterized protein n=1 Tax=Pseudoduganella danionis TaxID=1890295 RepID=A0ABW9SLF9_9BURK|nr:hypothetical protein [Pseudoduganella danionis]MTW32791.1 hypothetical protein [Pseudoduganella danionis]